MTKQARRNLVAWTLALAAFSASWGSFFTAAAQSLRHSISSQDNANSLQSQRYCYGLLDKSKGLYCLPVSNLRIAKAKIEFDSSVNSNEEAAGVIMQLSGGKVDRPFLEKLFRENNFQSVSGVVRIAATYGETSFSLVPYHFAGAYKISNPSLPDVSLATMASSSLTIGHNFLSDNVGLYNLLVAPSVYVSKKVADTGDFNVIDLAVFKKKDLIKRETWNEKGASLALGALSRRPLLPSVTLRIMNLVTADQCTYCRQGAIKLGDEIAPYGVATIGGYQALPYGNVWVGLAGKYNGLSRSVEMATSNAMAVYRLGLLDTYVSFAPAIFSFGFMFDSNLYRVGIQYTDEKQDNRISIPRKKNSYVHLAFRL